MNEIMREVDALGPAERDASGKVSFAYLKAVYIIADQSASKRFKQKTACDDAQEKETESRLKTEKHVVVGHTFGESDVAGSRAFAYKPDL